MRYYCLGCGHPASQHGAEGCRWARPRCECSKMVVPVTEREFQVLRLLAGGRSNKEAAESLAIGTKTVESHRYNLMRKTKCNSFPELMEVAMRAGMLTVEDLPELKFNFTLAVSTL